MVMKKYVPSKGDLIVLSFDPRSGHEQKGRRPALVISNTLFNQKTGLAMACPVTNTNYQNPFRIKIPETSSLSGFVMVDQIKSIDYNSRKAKFIEKAPVELLNEALAILDACLY